MTALEKKIANALSGVSFLAAGFDKRFTRQLPNWENRDMTENGRAKMIAIFHKYRRQIKNYEQICQQLNPENYVEVVDMFGNKKKIKKA